MRNRSSVTLWLALAALVATLVLPARVNTWPLSPSGSRLVDQNALHVVQDNGGSLEVIIKRYNVGLLVLLQVNPGVDPYVPRAGSVLTIPLQTLLSDASCEGLVINLVELCLYYYPLGKNEVTVYLIGIGQLDGITTTSTVATTVSGKRVNPTWTSTVNIRAHYKAMGIELPTAVPADPDNPTGHHAIRLAVYGGVYLLHGTNADFGIDMCVSSGYIHLRDNDIKTLYDTVSPGAGVNITNMPIKVSVEPDGRRLAEVRQLLSKYIGDDPRTLPIVPNITMTEFKQAPQTGRTVMECAMNYRSGIPINIARYATPGLQSLRFYAAQNKKSA